MIRWLTVALLTASTTLAGPIDDPSLKWWAPAHREAAHDAERALNNVLDNDSLRDMHTLLASEPHVAGTDGDLRTAERIASHFESCGLEVEMHEIWVYLAYPVEAAVEVVTEDQRVSLPLRERGLPEDADSGDDRLDIGWNAYSGSGEVLAEIVYANYGTKEDFETLDGLGVDVKGKIVLARYGGNFRGYKAKFAEERGAAGLIIYTDPADSGYVKGLMYPEGGYANESYIQRGSILTAPAEGDPLTPFEPATKDAERLDPAEAGLPIIPVQPVGPAAAKEIMAQMRGPVVPKGWQGGLPLAYRVSGGAGLKVRLHVKQDRRLTKTYNVLGTLRGSQAPDEKVIIGCHHDAWGFGASDPLAGLICVAESARCFGTLAERALRPRRSIVFAAWAAEEYGLIGSSEWVEANRDELMRGAVAYINCDMAAMGPKLRSSAAPSLKAVIAAAAKGVPQAGDDDGMAFEAWVGSSEDPDLAGSPRFGDLGGGSDHVGFYCHLAVPSASIAAGGSRGTSYHSNYDTLAWYRQIVGDDYESARMVTAMLSGVALRLADADLLPIDLSRYGTDVRRHLRNLTSRGRQLGLFDEAEEGPEKDVAVELLRLDAVAAQFEQVAARSHVSLQAALDGDRLDASSLALINQTLLTAERDWLVADGIPGRTWFRSLYAATDEDSGYAQWMLPALRHAIEHGQREAIREMEEAYLDVFRRLAGRVRTINRAME